MSHQHSKQSLLVILFFFFHLPLLSQKQTDFPLSGKTFESFIGKDFKILGNAIGDFNQDGKEDIVLALEYVGKIENRSGERQLLILFNDGNKYNFNFASKTVLLGKSDGGIYGDPFSEIRSKKNTFILSHYGGSAWRWGFDVQFRYQNKEWVLIGKKNYSYFNGNHCEKLDDFASTVVSDINFLTGDRYDKEITENCILKNDKKIKQKKMPLLRLIDYDVQKDD